MDASKAQLELSVIKKIMEDSRKVNIDNGIHYIFWGILVIIALLINYVMLLYKIHGKYMGLMWLILMVSGAIIDGFIGKREDRNRKVHTYASRLLGSLWMSSGIAMFMYGFIGTITGAYNPVFISPIISTLLGVSYFTSGAIQQIKWMQYLALGWWAGAVILFIFPSIHTLLIFAVMIMTFQLIPGIILNIKSKKDIALETSLG